MDEVWRPIPGWEWYEASSLGRIRSIDHYVKSSKGKRISKGRILKQRHDQHGYLHTYIRNEQSKKLMKVHRAVALAFLPNDEAKPCVNHKDNNPENNNVDNLEWCTLKENTRWMMRQGRADRTDVWLQRLDRSLEFMRKPVKGTNIATGDVVTYSGVNKTANGGFSPACVTDCCKGKRKTHKGYRWEYAQKEHD